MSAILSLNLFIHLIFRRAQRRSRFHEPGHYGHYHGATPFKKARDASSMAMMSGRCARHHRAIAGHQSITTNRNSSLIAPLLRAIAHIAYLTLF